MASVKPFVYYGTSQFSRVILQGLVTRGWRPVLVVTTEGKPQGRGLNLKLTPVAELAQSVGLPYVEVNSLRQKTAVKDKIKNQAVSFAILVAFGKIIPPDVLSFYSDGIVNIHPSLLPLYRGPAPLAYPLWEGQSQTGVSLMLLDEEMDHGPIIAQAVCPILPQSDAQSLANDLSALAINLTLTKLPDYLAGLLKPQAQNHKLATYTKLISKQTGRANFSKSANELNNQRRAFCPWPGLWTVWQGQSLKLLSTEVMAGLTNLQPGLVRQHNNGITIDCSSGLLLVTKLQAGGGKPMPAQDFVRGHPTIIGGILN